MDTLWQANQSGTPISFQMNSPTASVQCGALDVAVSHHTLSVELWPDGHHRSNAQHAQHLEHRPRHRRDADLLRPCQPANPTAVTHCPRWREVAPLPCDPATALWSLIEPDVILERIS